MIRSPMVRLLAIAAGISTALVGPAVSFAHGHAHSEAIEHAAHHATETENRTEHPAVEADNHDQDHDHPRLEHSAFSRVMKNLPAIRAETVTMVLAEIEFRETRDAPAPNESPPARPGSPPTQSRGPPAL
jgi:hypothetical protein